MARAVELENVWFQYEHQEQWALQDVSFAVNEGEFIGVVGVTGAGKSTICQTVNGLIPHYVDGDLRGAIRVLGQSTADSSVAALGTSVGLIFQDPESQIYGLTVEEEVAFGLENQGLDRGEIKRRIDWSLETVGISHLRDKIPYEMSGGQKQRLVLASTLALKPRILVLDEPTAELDPVGKEDLYRTLLSVRETQALTVLLVEQDPERLSRYADRILHLDGGRLVRDEAASVFYRDAPGLTAAGLHLPQTLDLAARLRARGWDLPLTPAADELADSLRSVHP